MQIFLQQVVPDFFEIDKATDSQLWNQTLSFSTGENVHIVAPSGSGKTSFIHFLYGLRKDYSGKILYDNNDIKSFDAEKFSTWRQKSISIIFQDLRLFTQQTVLQNLEIKRLLSPYHKESRITDMAKRLGIESKLSKLCSTCSYGEQQRIAIIRALQQPFDFLLLDEPFSHLDENNRQKAMELMQEEATERKAAIILTDLKKIDYFQAERVLYL
ncbi:ATP-binding cassette domain-containing protein [Ferruginibacter sp.]|uniref:ATP-binding cassette domain-containing protein n=1 Tax=Ferruginibacter sp. TaxID=1940288 RepID=UPI0019886B96|nr:ATP-binding cassette domain-containing protein [Ferruginibacter sp.]MBC7626107.1 ATP-binding cassette domain-containing protein [Ferruginibacter sp.]